MNRNSNFKHMYKIIHPSNLYEHKISNMDRKICSESFYSTFHKYLVTDTFYNLFSFSVIIPYM